MSEEETLFPYLTWSTLRTTPVPPSAPLPGTYLDNDFFDVLKPSQYFFSRQGGGTRNGTCYTDNECLEKGGIASGGCAQG